MARILIASFPAVGHVNPMIPLAAALVERGHEVLWHCSDPFRERIEASGARFAPLHHARDFSAFRREDLVPGGEKLHGIAALKVDLKYGFIDNAPNQLRDLQEITQSFRPDILLSDPGFVGGLLFHELTGTPLAVLNVIPLGLSSRDTAPNGLGLPPDASLPGRLRNRALHWAVEHVLFRDVQHHWNATRARLGLPPTGWLFDCGAHTALIMHPSVPGLEYQRSDLPPTVHFIGMLPVSAPRDWTAPAWWDELDGERPVIHITQGTVANSKPHLIAPALAGLAGEDLLVVVATGNRPVEDLDLGPLPANARIAPFLSYPELLPRTAAMVTNGGFGGTQVALSYGVPLVVAGTTEDKLEVAGRVAWSGAGINLRTDTPRPAQVRAAVQALLNDGRYRERAQALKREYASYNAVELGVGLIEQTAATGQPVLRSAASSAPAELVPLQSG